MNVFSKLTAPVVVDNSPISIEDGLMAGIEAGQLMTDFDTACANFDQFFTAVDELETVKVEIESFGLSEATLARFGAKMADADIAPSMMIEGVDPTVVVGEIALTQEGLSDMAGSVMKWSRAQIKKLVDFVKGLFDKLGKLRKVGDALAKKVGPVKEDEFAKETIKGIPKNK